MYRLKQNKIQKSHKHRHVTQPSTSGRIGKIRKTVGSSNIMSSQNRLTIHPGLGYLHRGLQSETARNTEPEDLWRERENILNEDLHGLLNVRNGKDSPVVRRSARILRKKANKNIDECTASSYYKQILGTSDFDSGGTLSDRSRSIFLEINKKYNIVQKTTLDTFELRSVNADFCSRLQAQVHSSFLKFDAVVLCKSKIFKMTEEINQTLTGKVQPHNDMTPLSPAVNYSDQRISYNFNFDLIPSSQWVYMTPPRQQLQAPKLDDCLIEPAVLYSSQKSSAVYGLKPNISVDLRNFENKQHIPVDHRYLQHLGDFVGLKQTNENHRSDFCENEISMERCNISSGASTTRFNFLKPSISTNSMSSILISRPQKTVQKLSRVETVKRKLDQCYEFAGSPIFLKNGTPVTRKVFQMTDGSMDVNEQEVNVFQFGSKKRLFTLDTKENMFSFKKDSSLMFNFSNLNTKD